MSGHLVDPYYVSKDGLRNLVTGALLGEIAPPQDPPISGEVVRVGFSDTFTDSISNVWTTKWGAPTVVNGRLSITPTTSFPGIETAAYPYTGKGVKVHVVDLSMQTGIVSFFLLNKDLKNRVELAIDELGMTVKVTVDGVQTKHGPYEFDRTIHQWLQFREQNGTLYVEYDSTQSGSDFTADWVSLWSGPTPFDMSAVKFRISSGIWDGTAVPNGPFLVDGVNAVSAPSDNLPVGMVISEDGSGDYTLSYSPTPVHPNLFVEHSGCLPIVWSNGTFKITGNSIGGSDAKGFHRFFSTKRFGGPDKSVIIKARGRYTAIYDDGGWAGLRGTKLGMKWPSLTDQSGYPKDDPRSVTGGKGYGQSSAIFSVGIHESGYTELARHYNGAYLDFKYGDTVAYSTGQWREETIQVDWLPGTKDIRFRFWRNATGTGTPNFDFTWANAPDQFHQPGFLWNRGDFVDFEYDWLTVEETTPGTNPGTKVLWRFDPNQGNTGWHADGFWVNGGASISYPAVSGSPDPSGKVVRSTIPGGVSHDGVKILSRFSKLSLEPRDEAYFHFWIKVPSSATGIRVKGGSPAKLGHVGLFGLPDSRPIGEVASGGIKPAYSWSMRVVTSPEDYLTRFYGAHPFCFMYYLYAEIAENRTRQQATNGYGIELPFRDLAVAGTPVLGVPLDKWVKIEGYCKIGPNDNRDGIARAWMDGKLVVDATDVTWNPPGYRQKINGAMTNIFHNKGISGSHNYDAADIHLASGR